MGSSVVGPQVLVGSASDPDSEITSEGARCVVRSVVWI